MKKIPLLVLLIIFSTASAALTPISYVSDYANIIPPEEEAQLNELIAAIEQNISVEIAVLTVPSLDGQDINQLAVEIFQQWGIGKKDVDNGLLIIIAPTEHEWKIEVGYGLEPVLPDAMAGRIGREHFTENFRAGKYSQGISAAVQDIYKVSQADPTVISKYQASTATSTISVILLFVFLAAQGIIVFKTSTHKQKIPIRLSSAVIMTIILLVLNITFAIIFFTFAFFMLAPLGGHGPGGFSGYGLGGFRGGRGGFGGGGFGGFGGGSSGGGGAGGKW